MKISKWKWKLIIVFISARYVAQFVRFGRPNFLNHFTRSYHNRIVELAFSKHFYFDWYCRKNNICVYETHKTIFLVKGTYNECCLSHIDLTYSPFCSTPKFLSLRLKCLPNKRKIGQKGIVLVTLGVAYK